MRRVCVQSDEKEQKRKVGKGRKTKTFMDHQNRCRDEKLKAMRENTVNTEK